MCNLASIVLPRFVRDKVSYKKIVFCGFSKFPFYYYALLLTFFLLTTGCSNGLSSIWACRQPRLKESLLWFSQLSQGQTDANTFLFASIDLKIRFSTDLSDVNLSLFLLCGQVTASVTNDLDRIIDANYYPLESAKTSNMRHRPIGIGVQGLADVFILLGMPFDSPEVDTPLPDDQRFLFYMFC